MLEFVSKVHVVPLAATTTPVTPPATPVTPPTAVNAMQPEASPGAQDQPTEATTDDADVSSSASLDS